MLFSGEKERERETRDLEKKLFYESWTCVFRWMWVFMVLIRITFRELLGWSRSKSMDDFPND